MEKNCDLVQVSISIRYDGRCSYENGRLDKLFDIFTCWFLVSLKR